MTEEDCRSKASGALQQKIWKPGELKMTKTEQQDEMDDQLQNKVWDPSILTMECLTRRSYLFLPDESDAGAPFSPFKIQAPWLTRPRRGLQFRIDGLQTITL